MTRIFCHILRLFFHFYYFLIYLFYFMIFSVLFRNYILYMYVCFYYVLLKCALFYLNFFVKLIYYRHQTRTIFMTFASSLYREIHSHLFCVCNVSRYYDKTIIQSVISFSSSWYLFLSSQFLLLFITVFLSYVFLYIFIIRLLTRVVWLYVFVSNSYLYRI